MFFRIIHDPGAKVVYTIELHLIQGRIQCHWIRVGDRFLEKVYRLLMKCRPCRPIPGVLNSQLIRLSERPVRHAQNEVFIFIDEKFRKDRMVNGSANILGSICKSARSANILLRAFRSRKFWRTFSDAESCFDIPFMRRPSLRGLVTRISDTISPAHARRSNWQFYQLLRKQNWISARLLSHQAVERVVAIIG